MPGRQITIGSGPRKGTVIDVDNEGGQMRHRVDTDDGPSVETPMETADRMSGDADTASNAGRDAQSTDAMNKYQ
jgi:hypothetical protein